MEEIQGLELKKNHNQSENHNHGHNHTHVHHSCSCGCSHSCEHDDDGSLKVFIAPAISFVLLLAGVIMDHFYDTWLVEPVWVKPLWFLIAFLPVGWPVVREAIKEIFHGDYFNELSLMSIACIGAFCIGEYSEAVGVMLFYTIGEILQDRAVDKATKNISKLLDVRPDSARIIDDDKYFTVNPKNVEIGQTIEVRPGERVPLDGVLESQTGLFDTAALTGESIPAQIEEGMEVLAGMISTSSTVKIKVTRLYGESNLSRILDLVKNAQERKAKSEVFIRKFARIYTPIVTLLAALVLIVPVLFSLISPSFHYVFTEWLYRALIFLVISCPCALVISVPLSYFAGIGAASKLGILFKGSNYLDAMTHVNAVAFDKTGTLTTGEFSVEEVHAGSIDKNEMLALMAASEIKSSHPLAKALVKYVISQDISIPTVEDMIEFPGKGTKAIIEGKNVLTGNLRLLKENKINYPKELDKDTSTIVTCAINGVFMGYVILSDTIKPDSKQTVTDLLKLGIRKIYMLSGDRKEIVSDYAERIGIKEYYGELLPQDKAEFVENIANTPGNSIAFVGDGMNDAPVLTLSNVGIAMGGLGSEAAIESADVVIQTDNPSKVGLAIKISRFTHDIIVQNIIGAILIKITILVLGLTGIASLWAAVFADVGVTMLAVLNSMRIMWKKY